MLTTVAINAALRIVSSELTALFDNGLRLGSACRSDYSPEATNPGNTILIPGYPGPITIELSLDSTEFTITDLSALIMNRDIIKPDLTLMASHLIGTVESSIIRCFGDFDVYDTGVGLDIMDSLYDRLMTAPPGRIIAITTDADSSRYSNISTIELITPLPEYQYLMHSSFVGHEMAMCLITRAPVMATSHFVRLELSGCGITLEALPDHSRNFLTIRAHMLYAVGSPCKGFGMRVPLHISASAPTSITSHEINTPPVADNGSTAESYIRSLPNIIREPVIERLRIVLESLEDTVPRFSTRLGAAIKLLERTEGITLEQLLEACNLLETKVDNSVSEFIRVLETQRAREVGSRQSALQSTIDQLESLRKQISDLDNQKLVLETEIAEHISQLDKLNNYYNEAISGFREDNKHLIQKLRQTRKVRKAQAE